MKQKKQKGSKVSVSRLSPTPEPTAQRDTVGRVHLRLYRDPASGIEHLALEMPVFEQGWQNEITVAAANTAHGILRGAPSVTRAVELGRSAMAATSRLSEGLLSRAPAGSIACKAGCDHCCYQSVGVTPPEALAIFDHLKKTRSSSELEALTVRVSELHEETRALTATERFSPRYPCPFLTVETGRCSIYEVRPLACRGVNSLDAEECASRLRTPEVRAQFIANGHAGRSFMEPLRAFHAVSAGLQLGLSELYGLDMRPLELTAALQLLLTGPEAIPRQWISGQQSFDTAVRRDTVSDPSAQSAIGVFEPRR